LRIYPIFVDYGQRASKMEGAAFRNTCSLLAAENNQYVEIPGISQMISNQLTDRKSSDPWFPMWNSLLIDIAGIYAHSLRYGAISIGLIGGPTFPDTSESFLRKASRSASASLGSPVRVYSPFLNLRKSELVALGVELV